MPRSCCAKHVVVANSTKTSESGWKDRCRCDGDATDSWMCSHDPRIVISTPQLAPQVILLEQLCVRSDRATGERARPAVPPPKLPLAAVLPV
jgi:hypothetical protein